MDLNSLPDELIAGIFKYNKYETVRNIRKLDRRMDRIGKYYDLGTRLPVEKLIFYFRERIKWKIKNGQKRVRRRKVYGEFIVNLSKDMWNYLNLGEYKHRGVAGWYSRLPNTREETEKLFCRIKIRKEAFLGLSGTTIDDRFLEVLCRQKNCFKNVRIVELCMEKCDTFAATPSALKQFFDKYDSLLHLKFFTCTGLDVMAKAIGDRKWSRIFLHQNPTEVKVVLDGTDKEFLHRVIKNCNYFCFGTFHEVKMCLTVDELLDFVEDCLLVEDFFKNQSWDLPLLTMGNLTIRDLCERLKALKELKEFVIQEYEDVVQCAVRLYNKAVNIGFTFEGRSQTIIYIDGEDSDDDGEDSDDDGEDSDDDEPRLFYK